MGLKSALDTHSKPVLSREKEKREKLFNLTSLCCMPDCCLGKHSSQHPPLQDPEDGPVILCLAYFYQHSRCLEGLWNTLRNPFI